MTTNSAAAMAHSRNRPTGMALVVRIAVVLVAVAALLSPAYAALRGLSYLNQPPPASWGSNAGTTTSSTSSTSTNTGTSGSSTSSSGFGGC